MAEIPPLPVVRDSLLEENPALKAYHGQISDFFKDLTSSLGSLTLAQNFDSAAESNAAIVVANESGIITPQTIPCRAAPRMMLYFAEILDHSNRPTGERTSGFARWKTTSTESGVTAIVTRCPGIPPSTTCTVSFLALLG